MNLISLTPVKRRRHGNYEEVRDSHRQGTICYFVSNEKGEMIRVCKQTFMNIFAISKMKLETIIRKKKMGETTFKDNRKSHRAKKFTADDRNAVIRHIASFPRDESHYSRSQSAKQYLSPELNIHRLYKAFVAKHPNQNCSYRFYNRVFRQEFPNLKFRPPRSDTCRVCDKATCEIKADLPSSAQARQNLDIHHRKAEQAITLMKQDVASSQLPGADFCCLSVDLQQVLFVPTLTHSDMFYASQLSCYNLGIHCSNTNTAYMCVWNEGMGGRGSNEVVSCILRFLNSIDVPQNRLVLWTDNCAGQNKNKVMIMLFIFLVCHGIFENIQHNFLISGHSFMACDRDFALIEKRKRVMKAMVPQDLHKVIMSAKYDPQFQIIDMESSGFWNLKEVAENLIDTKKMNISKAVMICIDKEDPGVARVKYTYSDVEMWKEVSILKKNKTIQDVKETVLKHLPPENKISDNKKKSLRSMIDFLENKEHKDYYRKLLH